MDVFFLDSIRKEFLRAKKSPPQTAEPGLTRRGLTFLKPVPITQKMSLEEIN